MTEQSKGDPTVTERVQPPKEVPTKILTSTTRAPSLIIVNTGNGKGKSTAAFGMVMRAVARGWKVGVIQFIKSGKWQVGEEKVCRDLGVSWMKGGDGFTWESDDIDRTREIAVASWALARASIEGGAFDVIVLDELTYLMTWGWIDTGEVVTCLRARPQHVTVIVTGRDAPQAVIDVADTVTEMRNIRHAFDQGVRARRGIDF
ncbi:MAG: cob(I)yrinic acid a,c-diamide adenosyltransferase [Acidobacteria bacterium]|nr:cob(I)yrinic acid a,c-diamide adenosyltransferase [Acidobacteriota bacterium]